jgi:hypothetical protein
MGPRFCKSEHTKSRPGTRVRGPGPPDPGPGTQNNTKLRQRRLSEQKLARGSPGYPRVPLGTAGYPRLPPNGARRFRLLAPTPTSVPREASLVDHVELSCEPAPCVWARTDSEHKCYPHGQAPLGRGGEAGSGGPGGGRTGGCEAGSGGPEGEGTTELHELQ